MDSLLAPAITRSIVTVEYLKEAVSQSDLEIDVSTYGIISLSPYMKAKVSWPSQLGATSYNVYGSPNPMNKKNRLNTAPITSTDFTFVMPVFPQTIQMYFWTTRVNAIGEEFYLEDEPATDISSGVVDENFTTNVLTPFHGIPVTGPLNMHIKKIVKWMRERHRFELENDGEDVYIYVRRYTGAPCSCYQIEPGAVPGTTDRSMFSDVYTNRIEDFGQKKDPDYQGKGRCMKCFGTGILGGYYPKFKIKIRYGGVPVESVNRTLMGWQIVHNFESWTLWSPKITQNDVIVRGDGRRYNISEARQSEFRRMPLHQEMNFASITPTDIRQQITDEIIEEVTHERAFIPVGTKVFG